MSARGDALAGCININSSDGETTGDWLSFIPDQDTTITTMTGKDASGAAVDYKDIMGLTGKTLKAGSFYSIPEGEKLTTIELATGQIVAYTADY